MKKVQKDSPDKTSKLMKGSDILVKSLENEGVEVVFAYPGGQSIDLHNAFTRSKKIRVVLPRHEQGCGFMAQGYARSSGKVGVCMTTSGPGAMNLITAIADAYQDSIPIVAITGQVMSKFIGKNAFQETDVFGMTLPVVKHSYLCMDVKDLPRIVKEAFFLAASGRPGPVIIDIPKDVQLSYTHPNFDEPMDLPGIPETPLASDESLNKLLSMVEESKRPVIYAGGGVTSANAAKALDEFSKIYKIPVVTTLMGIGCVDPMEEKNLYWLGMHGTYAGNQAVYETDLLISVGARFCDRVTGDVTKFAPDAKIVHIDIDPAEQNKNVCIDLSIVSEADYALERLLQLAKVRNGKKPDLKDWHKRIKQWKSEHPYPFPEKVRKDEITVPEAIETFYELSKGKPFVTTGVGQHQMWTPQHFIFKKPRQFVSSLGAGTMGFGLPAALGVKVANPDAEVVDIDGDGSFQMNIQEMATSVMERIPVKVMLMNNQFLGMVMQWEDVFYGSTRGNTELGWHDNMGGPHNLKALYPDYVGIAKAYGWRARRVSDKAQLRDAIKEMLESKESFLLEVVVPYDEHVLPFIPPGKSAKEMITGCDNCDAFGECAKTRKCVKQKD